MGLLQNLARYGDEFDRVNGLLEEHIRLRGQLADEPLPPAPVVLGPDGQPAPGGGGVERPASPTKAGTGAGSSGSPTTDPNPTAPGGSFNTGASAGTGGPFYSGPHAPFPITSKPLGNQVNTIKAPGDLLHVTSIDGKLTALKSELYAYVRAGLAEWFTYKPEGARVGQPAIDARTAYGSASAIFLMGRGDTGGTVSTGGGGGSGGSGAASTNVSSGGLPPTSGGPPPPTYLPGSQNTGPKSIEVKVPPPTQPTPGDREVVRAIDRLAVLIAHQRRDDGGAGLRASGLA